MSTLLIIILIALAVGLLIFAVIKKLFKLAIVAVLIALMFAGAFTVFSKDEPEQLVGGCAGAQANYTQECCDNWATENNMFHTECVGNWTIINNSCSWQCNLTPI